jgi:CO dehydrogenase/acetyl-CoA synthase delta subunit
LLWEVNTAVTLLGTGADIVVLRHPGSVPLVKQAITALMAPAGA